MKNKKRIGYGILITMILLVLCCCAGAEGAAKQGGTLHRPVPQRTRRVNPFLGNTETETCAVTGWTLDGDVAAMGTEFAYSVGILDGTNPDQDGRPVVDLLYVGHATADTSFSYTFYETGNYVLFVDVYGKDGMTTLYYECELFTKVPLNAVS